MINDLDNIIDSYGHFLKDEPKPIRQLHNYEFRAHNASIDIYELFDYCCLSCGEIIMTSKSISTINYNTMRMLVGQKCQLTFQIQNTIISTKVYLEKCNYEFDTILLKWNTVINEYD